MSDSSLLAYRAALLENLHVAVNVTDPEDEWRIREWNRGAERLFGHPARDTVGERISDVVVPGPGRERAQAEFEAAGSWYGRSWAVGKTGESVLIETMAVRLVVCGRVECVSVIRELQRHPALDASAVSGAPRTAGAVSGGLAPARGVVRGMSIGPEETDERLDEYLHGLLSANIRLARRLMSPHRSQAWMAKQLGVDRRVVVRWENGGPPKLRTVARIAGLLGQPLEFFYAEHAVDDGRDATP